MPSRTRRAPLAAVAVGWAVAVGSGGTAVAGPAPPFAELLRQALISAPILAESDADVGQAEGLARQGALRPNPTVGLEVEDFGGSRPFGGFDQSQTTLSIAQPLELGGQRAARVQSGRANIEAARARRTQGRADFAFNLAGAYLAAEVADGRLAAAGQALSLAGEDARIAGILVDAGKESGLRGLTAQSAVSAARAEVEAARAERASALARLTALANAAEPISAIPTGLLSRADRTEPPPAPDPLASPAVIVAQAAREAAARRVRVEQTRATPGLTVGLGVRRYAGEDATGLVASVSAPLPIFDRNRGAVSAAQAELRGAEARLQAARLDAEADIRSALAQAESSASRLVAAREGERSAQEAYRLTRLGYEGGKLPLIEVIAARRSLGESLARSLSARLDRLTAEASLARLQGRTPFGDAP